MIVDAFNPNSSYYPFHATCFDTSGNILPAHEVRDKHSHANTPAANTFVVGMIMHEMMTLDEPDTMNDFLGRILCEREPTPIGSVLDLDKLDERVDELARYANPVEAIIDLGPEEYTSRTAIVSMLRRWRDASYSDELKELVEACMNFLPEDRIFPTDLLHDIEVSMHKCINKTGRLTRRSVAAMKVFTKESDLHEMASGVEHFDRDEDFLMSLHKAYKWLDTESGTIRPDMDGLAVPDEVRAFFTPSMKERKNKNMLKRKPASSQGSGSSPNSHIPRKAKRAKR